MYMGFIEERRSLLRKLYDNPKYNAAFERSIDVMAQMLLKYGPKLMDRVQESDKNKQRKSAVLTEKISAITKAETDKAA